MLKIFVSLSLVIFLSFSYTYSKDKYITIKAVGDIMMGNTTAHPTNFLPPDDGKHIFENVKDILSDADITIGNLEGVLLDEGVSNKCAKGKEHCFAFKTPTRYVANLVSAGFDAMSLANNHSMDYGDIGMKSTMSTLEKEGINHSGLVGDIANFKINGTKIAFIAFSPYGYNHNLTDIEKSKEYVSSLAKDNDIVIVSFHGGAEGIGALNVKKETEYYYGENRGDLVKFSHAVIDAGADLVIGHGPHVPRALEVYKDRLIAYSLGNFATYNYFLLRDELGLAPILEVKLDNKGVFKGGKIISARQDSPGGPYIDSTNESAKLIKKLSKQDFGDDSWIENDGTLKVKGVP